VPGPGAYEMLDGNKLTEVSFTKSKRELTSLMDGPGPGEYKQLSFAEDLRKRVFDRLKNSKSLESQQEERRTHSKMATPGPGKYYTQVSDFERPNTGGKFGQGKRTAMTHYDEDSKPGPIYLPNLTGGKNSKKFQTENVAEKKGET